MIAAVESNTLAPSLKVHYRGILSLEAPCRYAFYGRA